MSWEAHVAVAEPQPLPGRRLLERVSAALGGIRFALLVYLSTRLLLTCVGLADAAITHHSLGSIFGHWDGVWYSRVAVDGYPAHPVHHPSTLGFFPLFPMAIWAVRNSLDVSPVLAGVLISSAGGLVATVLVQRLATGWWGEQGGRRATLLFCLFPGSVVFSMAYSEGLLIPLAAGCIVALERRRWLLAGILAGLATATGADAAALVLVCAISALFAIRQRRNWHSLIAPVLSTTGIAAFAAFLWAWTGTPFATLVAQRDGWHERLDPVAMVHQGELFASQVARLHFPHPTLDLIPLAALIGAVVLIAGIALLLCPPRLVSLEALIWTLAIGALALFSEHVGPNPRILITAFPAVLVFAHRLKGRVFAWLLGINGVLLAVMSALTFTGHSLTP